MFDPRKQRPLSFLSDEFARGHFFAGSSGDFRRALVAATVSPITVIAHAIKTGGATTNTTAAINCTGATHLIAAVNWDNSAGGTAAVSDSSGNTWVQIGSTFSTGSHFLALFEVKNPTVSAAQTFTASSGLNIFGSIAVIALNRTDTAAAGQAAVGASSASATTLQPGSLTPPDANRVVITALSFVDLAKVGNATINGGFTVTDSISDNNNLAIALAILVQTTATAANPTWTAPAAAAKMIAIQTSIKHS